MGRRAAGGAPGLAAGRRAGLGGGTARRDRRVLRRQAAGAQSLDGYHLHHRRHWAGGQIHPGGDRLPDHRGAVRRWRCGRAGAQPESAAEAQSAGRNAGATTRRARTGSRGARSTGSASAAHRALARPDASRTSLHRCACSTASAARPDPGRASLHRCACSTAGRAHTGCLPATAARLCAAERRGRLLPARAAGLLSRAEKAQPHLDSHPHRRAGGRGSLRRGSLVWLPVLAGSQRPEGHIRWHPTRAPWHRAAAWAIPTHR